MSALEQITPCFCNHPDCWHCNQRKLSPWIVAGVKGEEFEEFKEFNKRKLKTPEDVFLEVCRRTGANPDVLRSRTRKLEAVIPRQVYCFVARRVTGASFRKIGDVVGLKHSVVWQSCKKVAENFEVDHLIKKAYRQVESMLSC